MVNQVMSATRGATGAFSGVSRQVNDAVSNVYVLLLLLLLFFFFTIFGYLMYKVHLFIISNASAKEGGR